MLSSGIQVCHRNVSSGLTVHSLDEREISVKETERLLKWPKRGEVMLVVSRKGQMSEQMLPCIPVPTLKSHQLSVSEPLQFLRFGQLEPTSDTGFGGKWQK